MEYTIGTDDESPPGWVTATAILTSAICLFAGIYMLMITSELSSQTGESTITEHSYHAIGLFFIGLSFFFGPMLYLNGKRLAIEKQSISNYQKVASITKNKEPKPSTAVKQRIDTIKKEIKALESIEQTTATRIKIKQLKKELESIKGNN